MTTKFSVALHRPVLDLSSATTIGEINGFVVDPATHSISALRLRKTKDHGAFLSWASIRAFGPDAVTVKAADMLRDATGDELRSPKGELDLPGRRVLTDHGTEVGTVDDVEFDETSGEITSVHVGAHVFDGAALIGLGSYAAVVRHPAPHPG